jgi:gluconokinase
MTPAAEPLVLTVDVGTTSARALVFDARARARAATESRRPTPLRATADGGYEIDAEALFDAVVEVVDETLAKAGPGRIVAVACCTFWHSVMGVSADGRALTPAYTWGDTRAEPEGRALRGRLDERAYHARTGAFFHPLFWPAKLRWLGERSDVAAWTSFGEFLYRRLFGRAAVSVSMASGTGLLDVGSCAWDPGALEAAGTGPERLSPIDDAPARGLLEPFGSRWPALRDVPWYPPVGDGGCNNLGSGCTGPDRLAVMIGTSGAMRVVLPDGKGPVPWGLWGYRADRRRLVLGGALNDGGNLLLWCRQTLKLGSPEEAEREAAAMAPDSHGLTFLPFLAGERSPGWAAHARGAVTGLGLGTRPVQVLRAAMEAVALRFALVHRMILEAAPGIREVVASGGALLGSPAWQRILCDALGVSLTLSAEPEASCRGAALLVLEALGLVGRLEELPAAFGARLEPDSAAHAAYGKAIERQRAAYDLLVPRG